MDERLKRIEKDFFQALDEVKSQGALDELKNKFLGRKGSLNELFKHMASLPAQERSLFGQQLNELKNKFTDQLAEKARQIHGLLKKELMSDKTHQVDISLPAVKKELGFSHPLSIVIREICELFVEMGFRIVEGPEIETEYYNFEALNIPLEHPSRDVFDTFYIGHKYLLRSHTSPVQVRVMEKEKPPLQIIVPGKVYRPDATDASHSYMFHQIEGLLVDKGVSFAHLKGVLTLFAKKLFGEKTKMRFRPHFFPFTEPSAEVDISCIMCDGKGCRTCGQKGWLEILGAGLVHPNVFKHVHINSKVYSGFAFGMGIERIAMLKYGIDDIRLFFENDLRFIRQFE